MKDKTDMQMETPNGAKSEGVKFRFPISILIAVLVFIVGGAGGYILGAFNKFQAKDQVTPKSDVIATTRITPAGSEITKERRLLMTKNIEGGRIAAYRLNDDLSEDLNAGVFTVLLEVGQYYPKIFSVSSPAYSEDGLFEVAGDELWVVNGQTNKLDMYTVQLPKPENSQLGRLIYKESIGLPEYFVGAVYSIKCQNNLCKLETGINQESGCTMSFDLETKQFSGIKCRDTGGDFNPKPL